MTGYKMHGSGYCWELPSHPRTDWKTCHNDFWELEVYGPTGEELFVGFRYIDGSEHCVFACSDGIWRARLVVACRTLLEGVS